MQYDYNLILLAQNSVAADGSVGRSVSRDGPQDASVMHALFHGAARQAGLVRESLTFISKVESLERRDRNNRAGFYSNTATMPEVVSVIYSHSRHYVS